MVTGTTGWRLLIATGEGVRGVTITAGDTYAELGPRIAAEGAPLTLWLDVTGSSASVLLNDVQVSGSAELRSGDQVRIGEATVVVQQFSAPPATAREKLWTRADFDFRLREESHRSRQRARPLSYFLVRGKHVRSAQAELQRAARETETLVWGALGAEAMQLMVLDGPGDGVREALWRWVESREGGAGSRGGAALAPAGASDADELVEQALSSLGRGEDARAVDELLMLDPISVRLRALLERYSDAGVPLFLDGESGTGKAAWAWHAHARSGRRSGWWRLIDCRAVRDVSTVLFPVLDRGTLVLRHLEALDDRAQAQLAEAWPQDVGVIATSRHPFDALRSSGRLLDPLAQRFERGALPLPALRDRPSELLPLALQAVQQARVTLGRPRLTLGPETRAALQEYAWPGNVRELRNAVGLAALAAESDELRPENLPPEVLEHWRGRRASRAGEDLRSSLKAAEKDALLKVLAQTRWNVTAAAKELGLPRRTVVYRMSRLGLRRPGR